MLNLIQELITRLQFEIVFVGCAILLEIGVRSRLAKGVATKAFLVDLTYCAFYRFGIYAFLIDSPIQGFFEGRLNVQLIGETPLWFRAAIFLPLLDLGYYVAHRLMHAVPFLWAFHQVHHSQDDLGILTTYRLHPVDMWFRQFLGPMVFLLLLGLPPGVWLPLALMWDVVINLSHLEVRWTYGPLGSVFVSPVFHSVHHSIDERHRNANYSAVLSIWDRMFGTAFESSVRAEVVGLPGWRVRDSFLAHMWAPIPGLVQHFRGRQPSELAPLKEVASPGPGAPPGPTGG